MTRSGYCLAELLIVLSVIGICLAVGGVSLSRGVDGQQARSTAQSAQAAVAWAQVGVLWRGGERAVSVGSGGLAVEQSMGDQNGQLDSSASSVSVTANVTRWKTSRGVVLRILGSFASPDSGGSLYFNGGGGTYRVVVRPESGLTARSWSNP
jgi:Tfp pilus assembly protein FimT